MQASAAHLPERLVSAVMVQMFPELAVPILKDGEGDLLLFYAF